MSKAGVSSSSATRHNRLTLCLLQPDTVWLLWAAKRLGSGNSKGALTAYQVANSFHVAIAFSHAHDITSGSVPWSRFGTELVMFVRVALQTLISLPPVWARLAGTKQSRGGALGVAMQPPGRGGNATTSDHNNHSSISSKAIQES